MPVQVQILWRASFLGTSKYVVKEKEKKITLWSLSSKSQSTFLILSEFKPINFYSTWNHQKIYRFRMISGGIEFTLKVLNFAST